MAGGGGQHVEVQSPGRTDHDHHHHHTLEEASPSHQVGATHQHGTTSQMGVGVVAFPRGSVERDLRARRRRIRAETSEEMGGRRRGITSITTSVK